MRFLSTLPGGLERADLRGVHAAQAAFMSGVPNLFARNAADAWRRNDEGASFVFDSDA